MKTQPNLDKTADGTASTLLYLAAVRLAFCISSLSFSGAFKGSLEQWRPGSVPTKRKLIVLNQTESWQDG